MSVRPLGPAALTGLAALCALAQSSTAFALDPFTNGSAALGNAEVTSGAPIAVVDMNADGLDDIVRLHDGVELEIEYQQEDGTFVRMGPISIGGSGAWGMAIADVDNNGYPDIFAGGAYDGLKLLIANDDGTEYELSTLDAPYGVFVQCVSFSDINTDGAIDLFVCHDEGLSVPYRGDGNGNFTWDLTLISPQSTVPSDNSGNYGIVFTDYDLDGDIDIYMSKCRLFVANPDDGRRLNLLFENDGENGFTDVAEARGLQPAAQSWSADFADIDNDNDMDMFLTTHVLGDPVDHQSSTLYENDGFNNYTDITDAAGIAGHVQAIDTGIQTHFEDFDNDGFVDLLLTGAEGEHRLLMNNGDLSFTAAEDPFPTGGVGVQSAAVGDLNNDGFPDIIAGFANGYNQPSSRPDRLFLNPGNDNNWLNVRLTGVESNASASGAMIELHGAWGVQRREVRTGESYGIVNSLTRHFGLGSEDTADELVVNWPSGRVDTIRNPPINETIHITEGCQTSFYEDGDGDGYGNPDVAITACIAPEGYTADNTDCDDADGTNFPNNVEVCDGRDNDCDGEVDEGLEGCGEGSSSGSGSDTDVDTDTSSTSPSTSLSASATLGTVTAPDSDGEASGDEESGATDGDGCGCRTQGRSGALWLLALLVIPAVRRRR